MNLNNSGTGRKLLTQLLKQGKSRLSGWTKSQQDDLASKQQNPHNIKSRPKGK